MIVKFSYKQIFLFIFFLLKLNSLSSVVWCWICQCFCIIISTVHIHIVLCCLLLLLWFFKYANDYIKELENVNFIKLNSNEKYMTSLKMINGYGFYVVCLCCSIELHRLINDINTSYTSVYIMRNIVLFLFFIKNYYRHVINEHAIKLSSIIFIYFFISQKI